MPSCVPKDKLDIAVQERIAFIGPNSDHCVVITKFSVLVALHNWAQLVKSCHAQLCAKDGLLYYLAKRQLQEYTAFVGPNSDHYVVFVFLWHCIIEPS